MPKKVKIIKHLSYEELKERYKREKDARIKERLLTILVLYEGKGFPEGAEIVKRSLPTVKRWAKQWNERGYEGLIPQFTGGPKPKIDKSTWDEINKEISGKGMSIKDVIKYIKEKYGVAYSYSAVWEWLRTKMKVKYGKPFKKTLRGLTMLKTF